MASDPLKEVLLKVAAERRAQIDKLNAQLKSTFDPIVRQEVEQQLSQLQAELTAAEQALQPGAAPVQPAPQPTPEPSADPQLLAGEPVVAPKGPSKAALEAQIRELQTQLLD